VFAVLSAIFSIAVLASTAATDRGNIEQGPRVAIAITNIVLGALALLWAISYGIVPGSVEGDDVIHKTVSHSTEVK
jgi:hypothetical protein